MILLQLSSAQGPDECCLAVKKALDCLTKEAARQSAAGPDAYSHVDCAPTEPSR